MDKVESSVRYFGWQDIILIRLKGELYKIVVRPVTMNGSECWAVDRTIQQKMNGVTRGDKMK